MARIKTRDLKIAKNLSKKEIIEICGGAVPQYMQTNATHPELKKQLLSGYDTVNISLGYSQFLSDFLQSDKDREPEDEMGHGTG